jgi:hypothetical protein
MTPAPLDNPLLVEHAAEIRRLGKRVIGDVVEIGRHLTDAKALISETYGHGHWLEWLEREFRWTEQTALNFMRVHELAKSKNFLDLSLPVSGLYLLAAPSTPPEAVDEILERAEAGETLSVDTVKDTVAKAREQQQPKKPRTPRVENTSLARSTGMKALIELLHSEIEKLRNENTVLKSENTKLHSEIAEFNTAKLAATNNLLPPEAAYERSELEEAINRLRSLDEQRETKRRRRAQAREIAKAKRKEHAEPAAVTP